LKFGPVDLAKAEGAILAHAVRLGRKVLKKGLILGPEELSAMQGAGIGAVTVARLEPGDVEEDEAARRIALALQGVGVTLGPAATGRVNLFAAQAGLVALNPQGVDGLNAVTEDVTFATLPPLSPVEAGRMIATVKIIPFAVGADDMARCIEAAQAVALSLLPFRPPVGRLIQTVNDGLKASVIEKTSAVTAARLERLGGLLASETHCPHAIPDLTGAIQAELAAGCDVLLVIGASAIVDRRDVIPAAVLAAGGRIERLGMPVDPGNLILVGEIGGTPVLGLPGCARSPVRNGLDWVLERLSAGVAVDGGDIAAMGVGGLLIGGEEEKDYR
jgi:molybdenum cofactor cytidylyltransferase